MISGIGVFYPDRQADPAHRHLVRRRSRKPTIEGIRAGRNEVLETALRQILGSGVTDEEIRKMVKQ